MDLKENQPKTIDEYIALFPDEIRGKLQQIRAVIHDAAPNALEKISYGMPTFTLNGNLIHFAAYKRHIGLYPTPNGISSFEKELSVYKKAKGSVQFPLDKPLPLDLIWRIAEFRVQENLKKA